ncbi:hypothetical protein F5146DRAFT_1218526 [Armillaria mellea]|nr:hypothetical protein F5146DRAFT_1218526 [Armillaria mellea]
MSKCLLGRTASDSESEAEIWYREGDKKQLAEMLVRFFARRLMTTTTTDPLAASKSDPADYKSFAVFATAPKNQNTRWSTPSFLLVPELPVPFVNGGPDFTAKRLAATDPFEPDLSAPNAIAPFFVVRAFRSLSVKGARSSQGGLSSVINVSSIGTKTNRTSSLSCVAHHMMKGALDKLTLVLATSFPEIVHCTPLEKNRSADDKKPNMYEVPKDNFHGNMLSSSDKRCLY